MSDEYPIFQVYNESGESLPFSSAEAGRVLELVSNKESVGFALLELVYVTEEEIVRINKEHLDRDYITDIISFRYDEHEPNSEIEGTLYCCASRIKEQAADFNQKEKKEFVRIFIHGLLHLIGYEDQSKEEKEQMTALENHYLEALGVN